jgi:hypothetical protein
MARLVLALVAIVILILSAGLTHGQPQTPPPSAGTISAAALGDNTDTFRAEFMLTKHARPGYTAQSAPNEEPPALALLIYLALILVGGAGSVALARWRLHDES